jgi:hypothetical protein
MRAGHPPTDGLQQAAQATVATRPGSDAGGQRRNVVIGRVLLYPEPLVLSP